MWIPLQSHANIRCSLIGGDGRLRRKDKEKWKGVTEGTDTKGGKEEAEKNKWKIKREGEGGVERRETHQTNKKTGKRENQETVTAFHRCCNFGFYVHVTVHRNKFPFNKTNRRTNFPNLFLSRNSTCFGQFLCPSLGVFYCTIGTGICHADFDNSFQARPSWSCLKAVIKICMTDTSADCTVENSWWWAEELSETSRVSWQK